jgi:predicted 3-demethylubiquinone-9 3-methyltransferase (glyoxalase superfamily)
MMASVNVNGDEVVGTDVKQEAPCGFKFGFSIPTSCDSKTEIDNKMTVKSDRHLL